MSDAKNAPKTENLLEELRKLSRLSSTMYTKPYICVYPADAATILEALADAALHGEQRAQRRMLERAQVAQAVSVDDGLRADGAFRTDGAFGDYVVTRRQLGDILSKLRAEFEDKLYQLGQAVKRLGHNDGSKAIQGLDDRITGIAEHVDSMRGVFKLEGKENALALLNRIEKLERLDRDCTAGHHARMLDHQELMKRVSDLERNLGPDLKNEVAQAQIAKYQGLGKRIAALEAAAVPPGPPEHRDLAALDKHFDERVDALSKRVDALSVRLAALEAWLGR